MSKKTRSEVKVRVVRTTSEYLAQRAWNKVRDVSQLL